MDQFYFFDDNAKEICFKRHDTPTPWLNYLSNGTFHTMLSQAGGGVAFYKSPQIWRITRYKFYQLPVDRSGPYIYLKDLETGEYWCPTNEPAITKPEVWECRHGLGYTRFKAERKDIKTELTYFVSQSENCLIWNLKIKNDSNRTRNINLFSYVEFSMMEYIREVQWHCYIKYQVSVKYKKDLDSLIYHYGVDMQQKPEETPLVYFSADRTPKAYDGNRNIFIGNYRSETNPYCVEGTGCTNSGIFGGDPCGALQFDISLAPGQEESINIFLGTGMNHEEIGNSLGRLRQPGFIAHSFEKLKGGWNNYINKYQCIIPDKDAERMINIWNPYQCYINFLFSRNISFYATGSVRGVGFRDTAQDILAQVPFDIQKAKNKIMSLLSQQYMDGHVNHYFFPVEGYKPVTTIHSDDHLWLIMAVRGLIVESGDISFLNNTVSYYDDGEATVYQHLCKAIDFTMENLGTDGFPLMLRSDWNDMLIRVCEQRKGQSIWTAMQFGLVLLHMSELAGILGKESDKKKFQELYIEQKELVNDRGWDGKWFRRAIMDDGTIIGTKEYDEAQIWLNSQTWSVMSGMADIEKGIQAMNSVKQYLDTDFGIKKLHPSISKFPNAQEPLTNNKPGVGENGGIFCHANTWAIIAECLLGRGENAYKYYRQLIPNVVAQKVGTEVYRAEPFVYSSNIFGPESENFGMAGVSWLTGTAAWMYIAVTQYILGIRPVWEGLLIDPCIPADWNGIKIERVFRGCRYHIEIVNEQKINKGVGYILVNGKQIEGNIVKCEKNCSNVVVKVIMGQSM